MDDERYTTNFSMLFFSLSSAESQKKKQHAQPNQLLPRPPSRLLLDLSQNLRILEQEVFLTTNQQQPKKFGQSIRVKNTLGAGGEPQNERTSSPNLMVFPPQPGNNTRSPALTDVGTTRPSLSGAPGPTAITVASGSGLDVAEDGRKIPVA